MIFQVDIHVPVYSLKKTENVKELKNGTGLPSYMERSPRDSHYLKTIRTAYLL